MTAYATVDDWDADQFGEAPDDLPRRLSWASRLVTDAIRTAVYDVDTDGNATDSAMVAALIEATCIQAAASVALKIDPASGGAATLGQATSKSLDGASISYAGAADAAAARAAATNGLVPDAWRVLEQAGLTSTRVWTYG